ncbi:hypothetical protein J7L00_07140 [Candidatus Bathyarchaeota archaeon]|nr:hypothetical protein [Candidatus Bathyarchaeota archaeon]
MSIQEKLADYDQTRELLNRLSKEELVELAERNGVKLEWEDALGEVRKARTKQQMIDVLLESEFRASDLIELLGTSRLTKEELLNCMSVSQLRRLAREAGVELVKSTILGTKKATKKKDIIKALSVLSASKVREFAEKISLIKARKPKAKRRKPRSTRAKKRIISKKMRKAAAKPPKVEEKKPTEEAAVEIESKPRVFRRVLKRGGVVEEIETTVKQRVRRIILLEALEGEISGVLRDFSPRSAEAEREYRKQLSSLLKNKGIPVEERGRGDLDFVSGERGVAIEVGVVRSPGSLRKIAERISKYLDKYGRIFVVVVDETGSEETRRKAEEIEKISPEKVKVLVKNVKKKKR